MNILCLDLEGVLIPEVWQAVADAVEVEELRKTTRDIPVYDDLMNFRLEMLERHGITMSLIQGEISRLDPLPGARDFLEWARERFQVAIISDTFYEFAMPLMAKLGYPMLLCHTLEIADDRIVGYNIRQPDPKRCSVRAFRSLEYRIFAAGDSFNDISMLEEADHGFFYQAPETVCAEYPQYERAADYEELKTLLLESI